MEPEEEPCGAAAREVFEEVSFLRTQQKPVNSLFGTLNVSLYNLRMNHIKYMSATIYTACYERKSKRTLDVFKKYWIVVLV